MRIASIAIMMYQISSFKPSEYKFCPFYLIHFVSDLTFFFKMYCEGIISHLVICMATVADKVIYISIFDDQFTDVLVTCIRHSDIIFLQVIPDRDSRHVPGDGIIVQTRLNLARQSHCLSDGSDLLPDSLYMWSGVQGQGGQVRGDLVVAHPHLAHVLAHRHAGAHQHQVRGLPHRDRASVGHAEPRVPWSRVTVRSARQSCGGSLSHSQTLRLCPHNWTI